MNLREWALPVYTVLIEMAVGVMLALWILRAYASEKYGKEVIDQVVRDPVLIILITIVFGMIGAHFHLSKPYLSFLAFSNFRTSWLSREIIFTILLFLTTTLLWFLQWFHKGTWGVKSTLGWLVILFGLATIYCMGRIYLLPAQAAWNTPETIISFYGSMLLLGVMAMAEILIKEWALVAREAVDRLAVAAGVIFVPVVLINLYHLRSLYTGTPMARTSYDLLIQLYEPLLIARFLLLLAGVACLIIPVLLIKRNQRTFKELFTPAYWACLMVIIGEAVGRFLFYAAHIRTGL
jgi:anaerobic dimethyl sulfoxide reductase subunit C (anchor subunit)